MTHAMPGAARRRLLLATVLLPLGRPATAQVRDLNDAINKAGRQRMLSQRCAKAWLALGQGVRAEQAEKALGDSMALFDRQLVELRSFVATPELKGTYQSLDTAWSTYKSTLVGSAPQRAAADALVEQGARVLQLAHQGTTQLEQQSGRPVGRLVNIAGRQRMLSQRVAALYLAATWRVQPAGTQRALDEAHAEFVQAHRLLKAAPETTPAIRAELELAEQQFGFLDSALKSLRAGSADARAQADVFTTSERVLQVLDRATGLYAALA
ncbi:MAG: type IV pili methyl-accepting chemotaxis transducer N-terminal domain-containing protein [Rubrivivax sp.]